MGWVARKEGLDMHIRYWDLNYPANSHIVAGAASDPINQAVVSYRFVTLSLYLRVKRIGS